MNRLLLFSIVLVLFIFYGGKNVPKVMKNNKEILLGIVGGLVLCSFLGMNLEGYSSGCGRISDSSTYEWPNLGGWGAHIDPADEAGTVGPCRVSATGLGRSKTNAMCAVIGDSARGDPYLDKASCEAGDIFGVGNVVAAQGRDSSQPQYVRTMPPLNPGDCEWDPSRSSTWCELEDSIADDIVGKCQDPGVVDCVSTSATEIQAGECDNDDMNDALNCRMGCSAGIRLCQTAVDAETRARLRKCKITEETCRTHLGGAGISAVPPRADGTQPHPLLPSWGSGGSGGASSARQPAPHSSNQVSLNNWLDTSLSYPDKETYKDCLKIAEVGSPSRGTDFVTIGYEKGRCAPPMAGKSLNADCRVNEDCEPSTNPCREYKCNSGKCELTDKTGAGGVRCGPAQICAVDSVGHLSCELSPLDYQDPTGWRTGTGLFGMGGGGPGRGGAGHGTCDNKQDGVSGGPVTDGECAAAAVALGLRGGLFPTPGATGTCAGSPCDTKVAADAAACCTACTPVANAAPGAYTVCTSASDSVVTGCDVGFTHNFATTPHTCTSVANPFTGDWCGLGGTNRQCLADVSPECLAAGGCACDSGGPPLHIPFDGVGSTATGHCRPCPGGWIPNKGGTFADERCVDPNLAGPPPPPTPTPPPAVSTIYEQTLSTAVAANLPDVDAGGLTRGRCGDSNAQGNSPMICPQYTELLTNVKCALGHHPSHGGQCTEAECCWDPAAANRHATERSRQPPAPPPPSGVQIDRNCSDPWAVNGPAFGAHGPNPCQYDELTLWKIPPRQREVAECATANLESRYDGNLPYGASATWTNSWGVTTDCNWETDPNDDGVEDTDEGRFMWAGAFGAGH